MTVARFEGTDPVARYWLANCEGFAVEGAARGIVEELQRDDDPHVTARLVVRTRGGRRKIVQATSIATVVPADRVLVVERVRRQRPQLPHVRIPVADGAATVGAGARAVAKPLAAARRPATSALRDVGSGLAELAAPAVATVAHSLGFLAAELHATGVMVLRSARKRWTIVRAWR
jgi:hypothetical protein